MQPRPRQPLLVHPSSDKVIFGMCRHLPGLCQPGAGVALLVRCAFGEAESGKQRHPEPGSPLEKVAG